MGDNVAPGGNFNLHAEAGKNATHIGNGLLQRQVFTFYVGIFTPFWLDRQQRLSVFIEVINDFDLEVRAGLHNFLNRAAVDGAHDSLAVLLGQVVRQLYLNLENLFVAVFRINNVVLGQADVIGWNIPRQAVHLYKVGGAQGG